MFETDFFPLAQEAKHSDLLPESLDHLQENDAPTSLQDWGQVPGSRKLPEFRPDESRLKVFSALALGDDSDEEAKGLVKAEGLKIPTTSDEEACLGLDVCVSLFGVDQAADPYLYWTRQGKEAPRFKDMGEAHRAVWQDFSSKTRKRYADYQQKKAEFQRGLEEFGRELETALPEAVLQGKTLSPDMMEKATRYGQAEKVTGSLQRARAAVDLIRGVNRGGASYGAHEGAVHAETERILQEENKDGSYYRFLGMEFGKPKTEEEAEQQARANLGNSYEVTREFISHLANVLSDEDGQLDEGALGAMMLALDADAQGQQTIDSRFVRNTLEGLKRWGSESADFLNRYGMRAFDSVGLLAPTWQDDLQRYNDPRIEVLKDNLAKLEDSRLTASDKATFLAGMMTDLGTVTGESSPAILGGFINPAAAAIAFIPSAANRSIASNHAEGNPNAELTGLIEGTFEGVAESFFGVATKSVPIIGKALDKAALGLMSRPALGKIASKVQGNVYLRYLSDRVVAESLGELVGEEVISQTGSYLTIQAMRQMGVDMKDKQWVPFSTAWETIQDERQSTATVVYCAALGLMGLKADMNAAAAFSRSRKNLETVGLKPETSSRLALMAEQAINRKALLQQAGDANAAEIQRTEDELQKELQKAYLEEVVNEDPVKLRDRLRKNHELFMSEVEAQAALREGVLKAALREQGVLDVEESLTGKNVVTVEDTEQAEKDRASWQDGKMPEGYETPVKKVEWTDEQLAAYSQYAIGNEGLKRMKAIRSAALNLDMAAKVNEKDYARTLPLTESSVPVAAELARSKGAMTIDVLRALSEAAAREGENGRSVLPGVSNAAVRAMEGSFMKRLQWEARSGDTAGASRMLAGEGGAAAIRLTAGEGPASRIVYNPGHTLSTNLAEDVVESMLVDKLQKEGGMDGRGHLTDAGKDWLSAMHREMREVRRQVLAATGRDIMPGLEKAEPSLMNVTEYFSHLSQSAFYRQAGKYGLNDAAMRHVKFMDSALIQAKFLNDMGAGFAKWADTEAGRAWQKEGGTLAGLLQETGHELADLYTNSRVTAENVAAVEEARMYRRANGTRTVEDIREELEEAAQEGTPVTPESELEAQKPQEIPAEESITGESIPAEANEEAPDEDPESGQFVPPPGSVIETDPEGKGRGLEGGRYAEDGVEGSVIGMVPFSSLVFSEWPFSRFAAADGMAEALRHADGRMEVIMGGALLRQDERARSVKVRVWDADAAHNEAWARGRVLEQIALAGLAPKVFSVRDYLEYYRHLYPAGLPGKETLGKLGKKAFQAVAILEKAAPEVVRDVLSGAVSAADAYAAAETASTQEGQRFYLDQKAADRKASLEYLTALTRAWEAAPGTDADMLRRQARYVVAARKEIRKAVARLQDVRGEKPRAVAQRELGIDLPTAEAVADAMKRLGLLDASFDAFEADLDVPGRAAEWDGKSPTGVVGSFFQTREEVKEMKAGTEASEAAGRAARERDRQTEQDDALMEQARKLELPASKKWMKPRTVPLTEAQAQEAIVKALQLTARKGGNGDRLTQVLHEFRDGREYFVSTDGFRMSIVHRMAPDVGKEGDFEFLGGAKESGEGWTPYSWQQLVPPLNGQGTRVDQVDLSRFNFLEDARNGKDDDGKPAFRTRDGWRIGLINHGKIAVLNPEYVASLLKQVKKLNRELGMPNQAEVTCPADPYHAVRFDIGAGEWTFTSVLMTVRDPEESLQPKDIVLNAYGEQASTLEASRPPAEEADGKTVPDKLEDAGREIRAHKDRYSDRITEPLKAEMPEDFSKVTASRYFPEPDWEKLVNDGVSQDVIVAVALIRNLLPDKPRGRKASYLGKEWLNAMKMYRRSTAELLEGSLKPEEFFAMLAKQGEKWERQVDLFRGLGYPYCLKAMGMQLSTWTSYPDRKVKWRVERHMKGRVVISGDGDVRMYDTKEEAIEAFRVAAAVQSALDHETKQKEGEDGKSEKKRKDVKLTIRYYNSGPKKGEYFICRDLPGSARIKLKDGLASGKEAREYMYAHMDELQEKLRRIARKPDVMLEVSSERVGEDYRNGKNVDNAMLMETFGINGITYGNWVSGPERQAKLNATYDAFLDLAHLLGIPPRAISLNGSLGFQFGASGVGRYSAHYRPADVSINLTRKKGDGSLAHEWWHALDHYFMRAHAGMNMELASNHTQSRIAPNSARRTEDGGFQYDYQYSTPGMNEDAGRAFAELVHAIQRSRYAERSTAMGRQYWGSNIEMTARAFQTYIVKKARDAGVLNEYLSAYQSKEVFSEIDREFFDSTGIDRYPYPTDEEMEKLAPLFDRFFAALTHVRQENGNYVTFSVTDAEDMGSPAETTFPIVSAQEQGLFLDGHFEAGNAVITEPGVTFSISALHASPHSFRKFSTDYMGQGEGAQAYGWGLYFAESEKVNRDYLKKFARDKYFIEWRGRRFDAWHGSDEFVEAVLKDMGVSEPTRSMKLAIWQLAVPVLDDNREEKLDYLNRQQNYAESTLRSKRLFETELQYESKIAEAKERLAVIKFLKERVGDFSRGSEIVPASNYRVELNVDDSELLGWDYVDETVLALLKDSRVEEVRYALERAERRADDRGENVRGKDVYQELFDAFWDGEDGTRQEAQKAASVFLLSSDIKGIRYADGLSRGKAEEEQTYNYVIFNEKYIKITAFADESTGGAWVDYEDPTASFSVTALDGDGTVLRPEAFITRPDGNPDWFTIPKRRGQAAMPVRLLAGKDMGEHKGYGLTHIAASRDLDGLWARVTPERYLSNILANASELYLQGDREILVKGKRPSSWIVLQLVKEDGYYSIVTAHPVNNPNKKPQGKRIPFDGRFSSTPGKEATGVWGLEEKYSSGGLPSKGGALGKASQEAMTADRGYAYSLPPGAHVVNINDVRLRFDDGRQMNAGGAVSTMSLALMDDGLDTAPHLKEHVVQQLIGDVRTAVRRFNRVFAGNTGVEAAAREMGQAQALLGMINKYAARGYRPRLTAQMRYVEVYARMLESGKILSYGKLNAQELESLKEDLEAELSDAVDVSARGIAWEAAEGGLSGKHELERLEIQARQEVRDLLVRDYAGRKLDEVVRDMLNQGAAQLEKQLKDEEMARIGKLLDFIRPRRDPKTGKLKKGLMNADAYRRVARITRMMEAPAEKKAEEMERLNVQLAGDGLAEADHDRIALELLDWSAYGALESMSLDAVRAAGESLRELVLTERNVWESKLEDEKRRLKKVAQDAAAVLGRADATKMRQMTEKEERTFRKFGVIGRHLMSFSQAMYAMSGMPGVMKDLARETLDAVADGHVALTAREKAVMDELEGFMKEELGLKEKRQRADFIQGLKKTIKTGIVREKVRVHSLDLTVEEAQRWISMSREERQAERDRMREEAEIKGWAVEAMVEEDDVLPLKEAVHSALNPPPRIDGKKGRKRERVQVRREFMEKQEPLEASADQLLNVILTYEQPFYEENARMNGYTPEVLDALRRKVGADALAFGYKMRELLSDSGVAEEFERREGVPFPAQANYWMSRFHDPSRINQDRDALDMETGTGTRYGMLVQRVDHRHEVDLSLGASNVFLAACTQQNNYLIMGRMTARWRRLLANKEFAGALKQRLGDGLFSSLRQMVDLFDGAGVMEAVTQRTMGSLLGMIQNAHAVSVLSAALTTIAKQPSALMHAAAFKSPARVMKQLLLDRAGAGRISFAEMLRKPFFQARFKDDRVFVELMRMGANAKWTRMAGMARVGMQALEHVDVWSNCASMTALYNLTWQDLEKENRAAAVPMTEEQMEEVCDRTVKNALELVGQPQRLTQRSMMAALGKSSLWVRMSCYMGSEALNKVGMSAAIGEKARAEGDGVVKRFGKKMLWLSTMSGVEQVILMLLDLMRGNGPDDDEVPEWLVYNSLTGLSGLGLLNTLPILGPTLEEASGQLNKLITGNGKGFIKTGLLDDMLFNLRGWIRCVRKFGDADKMSGEEMAMAIHNLVRLGAAGTGLGRGVNSTMQWTSTLSGTLQSFSAVGNMLRPLLQRAINEEKQEKKERRERMRRW